ncbi:MAG: nucleotidyltransferase domain-containing protein [Nanoarchaeota archaeon]
MKTEIKIIEFFLNNKNKEYTIREISKIVSSDYKIVNLATHKLIEKNILKTKKIGPSTLCYLNNSIFTTEIFLAENQRKEKIQKNSNLKLLTKEIQSKLNVANYILLLFGSFAKGTQTKNSDLDLIFISNEKEKIEKQVKNIFSISPIKIDYYVFTEDEFKQMRDSKERNVIHEAIENNIILYSSESYYKLKNDN